MTETASNGVLNQRERYSEEWQFVKKTLSLIEEKLSTEAQLNASTIVFSQPKDLEKKLDLSISDSSDCGRDLNSLVKVCSDIMDNSVKTSSPMFFQQLYHGVDPYGLPASFLIEALNTSTYTFDVGPVVTMIEKEVTQTLVKLIGWQEGDGIFCPGNTKKLDLSISDSSDCGRDLNSLVKVCSDIMDNSVKTSSPMFFQQLYHGVDPYGLAASFLIEALNTSTYTFDVGPVVTMIEKEVTQTLVKLIGWQEGDGIFCPGGSMANMYAVSVARHKLDNSIKTQGMMKQQKLVIFASDQAHYSVIKAAAFMGFGIDSVIKVKSDDLGRMDTNELKEKIIKTQNDEDSKPFLVWCTSGTTVLNAYDPLPQIHSICKEFGLWMHVDACLGGAALWSNTHKHLLEAVERSDSMSWCWHKVLGAPFQTSLFLTKHKGLLSDAHSASASYLFLSSKHYDTSYDTGDCSIQCGRKADAVKVWFMLKARGHAEIEQMVNAAYDAAKYLCTKLKENNRFRLVVPDAQGTSVCFWVIPPSLSNQPMSVEYNEKLNEVAPALKRRMVDTGLCMVAYQPMAEKLLPNFFRVTFACHPISTKEEIDKLIEILINLSDDL